MKSNRGVPKSGNGKGAPLDDSVISQLGKLFIERRDVYATQHSDGSYTPTRETLRMSDLRDHVSGKRTLGHYLLSADSNCRLFVYDIDFMASDGKPNARGEIPHPMLTWLNPDDVEESFDARAAFLDMSHWARPLLVAQLNAMAEGLARRIHRKLDIPVACAFSGAKGAHVYGFTGSAPAGDVRAAAHEILNSFGCFVPARGENFLRHESPSYAVEIEVFPKQDSLEGKDLGNLVRLPLGVNRKTGNESYFLQFGPSPTELKLLPATEALSGALPWE